MKICSLGDMHFGSSRPWSWEVNESVISWMINWEYNTEENVLIQVGDLVESHVNGGDVIYQLTKFIEACKFKKIIIVKGNHDEKKKDGKEQLAYSFLERNPKVVIIRTPEVYDVYGIKCLMLPHIPVGLVETYSDAYNVYKDNYDILFGHFSDDSLYTYFGPVVKNLDKIKVNYITLGHIHTRASPRFIGSMFPNNVKENDDSRSAWIYEVNNGAISNRIEDPLPKFCKYFDVVYPEPLPDTSGVICPIYTVYNCISDVSAKEKYGQIFIRKTFRGLFEKNPKSDYKNMTIKDGDFSLGIDEVFDEYCKSMSPPLSRDVAVLCKKLLTEKITAN